jgi:anoctamin-10
MYHLVNWRKELGGAGITPEFPPWENVKAIFPLHNQGANRALLAHLSTRVFLEPTDLDRIRDLWGAKVAFYFAFIQFYFRSLAFPCIAGILAWAFLPKYSLVFALSIGVWCTVFLEYWKIKQTDLAIRWNVRGVGDLKVNRPQFRYDQEIIDSAGRVRHVFPRWKRIVRQLVVIPFVLVSTLLLGVLIAFVFAIETFIGEAYDGPYKFYLVSMLKVATGGIRLHSSGVPAYCSSRSLLTICDKLPRGHCDRIDGIRESSNSRSL